MKKVRRFAAVAAVCGGYFPTAAPATRFLRKDLRRQCGGAAVFPGWRYTRARASAGRVNGKTASTAAPPQVMLIELPPPGQPLPATFEDTDMHPVKESQP